MDRIDIPFFRSAPDWKKTEKHLLSHHLWADEYPAFYESYIQLCAVEGKGFYARLYSAEPSTSAVYTERDDPVYNDSCMEIFLQPFCSEARYINIEINPNGAYLSEIGTGRPDRVLLKECSDTACETVKLEPETGWGAEVFIPFKLVSDCFGTDFYVCTGTEFKMNAYKCGDGTEHPHYSSLFRVGTPKPDYHRPEFFGTIKLLDERAF